MGGGELVGTPSVRITVIVPHFNDARYIDEAIASVREEEPIEILIVDDASTDDDVADVLVRLEARGVLVLREPVNRGVAQAVNRGVAEARTPYVFLLGADDLLVPGALARLADALDADPGLDFAYGDYEFFGARTGFMQTYEWEPWRAYYACCWMGVFMIRRSTHQELGGVATRSAFEDWDFFMTLAEEERRGLRVPGVSFHYRIAESGRRNQSNRHRMLEETRLLRAAHPKLARNRRRLQRQAGATLPLRIAYPVIYGLRARLPVRVGDAIFDVLASGRRKYNRMNFP